jgi:uncharacterized protein (DUF1501 family)
METSRRKFIKQTILGTTGTLLVPGFLKALENRPVAELRPSEKVLVVVQLSGGNDGLNTIIPYQNDLYYQLRPQLAIRPENVIKVSEDLGFHPALSKLRKLYDEGHLAILNNVGYPNPDRSHFRSMDIWHSASDADKYLTSGWIGRYLDSGCTPCQSAHHAIEVDDTLSMALKGNSIKGMAVKKPEKLYQVTHNNFFNTVTNQNKPDSVSDPTLHYLYKTMAETVSSAEFLYARSQTKPSRVEYPQNEFSKRLKTIAELIHASINTRVYYVTLSGFDTHVNQENQHQRLLKIYSEGISAFVEDLGDHRMKDVVILTFSEFGRRVAQNASGGTDHGTANNVFVISGALRKKGFLNSTPDLSKLDQGDLIHQLDFRSIYATLLNKWLEVPSEKILNRAFPVLDFI